jgi:hypothetical protein
MVRLFFLFAGAPVRKKQSERNQHDPDKANKEPFVLIVLPH